MPESASRTARARARDELTREIKGAARARLRDLGSEGLSLRAVARDLGFASSAVYRYFPSRDELLTALIIDAFDAIGEVAEAASASRQREDFVGRWRAGTHAVRAWALAHRHEYALIYGTPVPGYRAPVDTVAPATRITNVLLQILRDACVAGVIRPQEGSVLSPAAAADLARLRDAVAPEVPDEVLARGLTAWMSLFGSVSFELFGHLHNVITDNDGFFDVEMKWLAEFIGFPVTVAAHEEPERS